MFIPVYQRQFERDIKNIKKRSWDISRLKNVIERLLLGEPLSFRNRNHKLKGNFKDYWECHIKPDWLLIYKKTSTEIIFGKQRNGPIGSFSVHFKGEITRFFDM